MVAFQSATSMHPRYILNLLRDYGLLTDADAGRVLKIHEETDAPPGQILIHEKLIKEKQLFKLISSDLGMNTTGVFEDRNYEISAKSIARFGVNGDFYGLFQIDPGRIVLTLCDVSGKGLEAGILAILLAQLLREDIHMKSFVPKAIMKKINVASANFFGADQFATFIVMMIDMYSGTVEYSAAGAPPILHYRFREHEVWEIDQRNIPIGIDRDFQFKGSLLALEKGDILLMFTDGAFEAQNRKGEFYGLDRIRSNLLHIYTRDAGKVVKYLMRLMRRFSLFKGLADDTTYIAIKRRVKRK